MRLKLDKDKAVLEQKISQMQHLLDKKQADQESLRDNYTKLIEAIDVIKHNYANEAVVKKSSPDDFCGVIDKSIIPVIDKYEDIIGKTQTNELMQSLKRIQNISKILEEKGAIKTGEGANNKTHFSPPNQTSNTKSSFEANQVPVFLTNSDVQSQSDRPTRDLMGNLITDSIQQSMMPRFNLKADTLDEIQTKFVKSYVSKQAQKKPSAQSRYNIFNMKQCESIPVELQNNKADDFSQPNDMILLSEMKAAKDSKAYFEQTESSEEDEAPPQQVAKLLSFDNGVETKKDASMRAKKKQLLGLVKSAAPNKQNESRFRVGRSNSVVRLSYPETAIKSIERNKSLINIRQDVEKMVKKKPKVPKTDGVKTKLDSRAHLPPGKTKKIEPRTLTPKIKSLKNPKAAPKPKIPVKVSKVQQNKELTFSKIGKSSKNFVVVENSDFPKVEKHIIESSFFQDSIIKSSKRTEQETDSKTHHNGSLFTKKSKEVKLELPKLNIQILKNSNSKIRIKEGLNAKNEKCILIDVTSDVEDGQEIVLHSDSFSINTLIKNNERFSSGPSQLKKPFK